MQTHFIPGWFCKLASNSQKFHLNFTKKFKDKKSISDSYIDELIDIFGRINQPQLMQYISPSIAGKIKSRLQLQSDRFQKLLTIALEDLQKNRPLNLGTLNQIYDISVLSPNTLEERAIRDIALHLLSFSMPRQESIHWQCHSVAVIKRMIDQQQEELDQTIAILFKATLPNQPEQEQKQLLTLTLEQECQLFKYAALKCHGRAISWGYLLFVWSMLSEQQQTVHRQLRTLFHFDKLLFPDKKAAPHFNASISISFQDFVVEQTMDIILKHPNGLLPANLVEKELRAILIESSSSQQNAMYFIDYLHSLMKKEENFPFEKALKLLNDLIVDRKSQSYLFLHTCLHFFHCMKKFSVEDKECAEFLFEMIHHLDEKEKHYYHKWIYEDIERKPFQIHAKLIQYVKARLSPHDIGLIILRSAMTTVCPNKQAASASSPLSYLSFDDHLTILQKIEQTFGFCPPAEIIADFLFFQTATPKIFEAIDGFVYIYLHIMDKHLHHLSLPSELYSKWETQSSLFINAIEFNPSGKLPGERKSFYTSKIFQLAIFLQMATYPKIIAPFCHFMPESISKQAVTFDSKNSPFQHRLHPIHPDFPSGPARHCEWLINEKMNQILFSVSLVNSLQRPTFASLFQIPLPTLLLSKPWLPTFMTILNEFVDAFGKESLSEDEEGRMRKLCPGSSYRIPDECFVMEDSSSEFFDAILHHSPVLQYLWNKHSPVFDSDLDLAKNELYTFIRSLHVSFKKSFYLALCQQEKEREVFFAKGEENIEICCFKIAAKNEEESPFDPDSLFEKIYQEIKEMQCILSPLILSVEHSKESSFTMKVESLPQDPEEPEHLISVSMEIASHHTTSRVPAIYGRFVNKEQYLQLMRWQLQLVQKDYLRLYPRELKNGDFG